MSTLTRAQLAALTELHRVGALTGQGRGVGVSGVRQGTLNALYYAGVAKWPLNARRDQIDVGRRFVPALAAWADGSGTWHVAVPDAIVNGAAVARAVIAGEVWARESQAYIDDWRPRVELDTVSAPRPGFTIYREV